MVILITGDHIPSSPASSAAGWMPLVGHTFMHSPQRMHFERNSSSPSDPGGRTSSGLKERLPASGCVRNSNAPPAPATPEASNWRRPKSRRESFGGFRRLVPRLKVTAREGQSDSQLKQKKHSAGFHSRVSPTLAPPWQSARHRRQLSQASGLLWSRTSGFLPAIPSSAPSGQIYRHQKRAR